MYNFNDELAMYQQQIVRKQRLEEILSNLDTHNYELEKKTEELAVILNKEQKDVEKIEGVSLSAILFDMVGKREERIDKEKREAYAAALKYDNAKRELEEVNKEIEIRKNEYNSLLGCEDKYRQLFRYKVELIKCNDSQNARNIINIESKMSYLNSQIKEIKEAIAAGKRVLSFAHDSRECLDSTDGCSTWDMFSDGIMSDIKKNSRLDEAQECICRMQSALRKFRTELSDVKIDVSVSENISGFTRFADYFFDGLFSDLSVKNHIELTIKDIDNIQSKVTSVINKLERNIFIIQEEIDKLNEQYEYIVASG